MVLTDTGAGFTVADAILVEPHEIETLMVAADGVKFVANDAQDVIYVHADHLGAPQKMTDDGRTVIWDAAFTPFGEEDSIVGAGVNNWRFPGQYAEDETGFHYNWFRHYDPSIGRYIQSDPIGLSGGWNTYVYASASPILRVDPFGLSDKDKKYGLPKDFWDWYHGQKQKDGKGAADNLTHDEAIEEYNDWVDQGKPRGKGGKSSGGGKSRGGFMWWDFVPTGELERMLCRFNPDLSICDEHNSPIDQISYPKLPMCPANTPTPEKV